VHGAGPRREEFYFHNGTNLNAALPQRGDFFYLTFGNIILHVISRFLPIKVVHMFSDVEIMDENVYKLYFLITNLAIPPSTDIVTAMLI
jgi:hypothetical protein